MSITNVSHYLKTVTRRILLEPVPNAMIGTNSTKKEIVYRLVYQIHKTTTALFGSTSILTEIGMMTRLRDAREFVNSANLATNLTHKATACKLAYRFQKKTIALYGNTSTRMVNGTMTKSKTVKRFVKNAKKGMNSIKKATAFRLLYRFQMMIIALSGSM